ncbi:hypothetical protein GRF29_1536g324778 [Pseudopithomyces chartarum]|uniref:Ubiquitin-like protease family profile domain-containing protein n=1 Tax=Pseudopithomyces chartarum TaxID=1892770 RepID=A0AAN6LLT6_9PLEO|nr:hypothetical protein GRF29_1536g324778 [Pseudopithomyces chartarum]
MHLTNISDHKFLGRVHLPFSLPTYLSHAPHNRYLNREELSQFPKANISFLATSTVSLLKIAPLSMCQSQFATPSYRSNLITHIFLPLNDDTLNDHSRRGPGTIGGHWSLLVVSLIDNVAEYIDAEDFGGAACAETATVRADVGERCAAAVGWVELWDVRLCDYEASFDEEVVEGGCESEGYDE